MLSDPSKINPAVAVLALMQVEGAGIKRVNRILRTLLNASAPIEAILQLSPSKRIQAAHMLESGLMEILLACNHHHLQTASKVASECRQSGVSVALVTGQNYPPTLLANLGDNAPLVIFFQGNAALLEETGGAVVGTRNPTSNGLEMARKCARTIVKNNAVMISGAAQGIDTAAHDAALEHNGKTVFVLPEGIIQYAPPVHWLQAMKENRALMISETLPYQRWQTHAAVSRNRLIAALARMVCVIEPRKLGGSIRTARHALEQGKTVFLAQAAPLPPGLKHATQPLVRNKLFNAEALSEALKIEPKPMNTMSLFETN